MNPASFGIIGYLGLVLAAGAVGAWLAYWKLKRTVIARAACGLAAGALVCAMVNSSTHVDRIQVDPAEQLAKAKALEEAQRQELLESRGEAVADIRFAEDASGEYLDTAGMDEADLKYMQKLEDGGEPAWKQEKKTRSAGGGGDDDSLDALIDTEEQEGGAEVEELEEAAGPEPILLKESEVVLANRLDGWNLDLTRWLLAIGVAVLGYDYLRRVNIYREATVPLPLPSALPNAITPPPAVLERPAPPRRSATDELAWLARRGDVFLYLADEPGKAAAARKAVPGSGHGSGRREVLRVDPDDPRMTDDFVFEALWFRRGSFVVDSAAHAERLLARFRELWRERRSTRARTRQQVHVVWDLDAPVPADLRQAFTDFAGPAGFTLFVIEPKTSPA